MSVVVSSMSDVVRATAQYFRMPVEVLLSADLHRTRDVTYARHIAQYVIRKKSYKSLAQISRLFGRNHATTYYAINKISTEIADGKDAREHVAAIELIVEERRTNFDLSKEHL